MKTIIIGFSKPINRFLPIGSWLIRAYMGTDFSHTYTSFHSDNLDRDLIYEAVGKGTRFCAKPIWELHEKQVESYEIQISEDSHTKLMQFFVDNCGNDYGYLQNIGIVIANLLNLKKNPFDAGENCSEVIGLILQLEGYKLIKEPNLLTPKDIRDMVKNGNS